MKVDYLGPVPGATWTAGQVAERLDIAEATLRSWHRRYGVGPQGIQPGKYRRYDAADFARLQRMRDLIDAGTLPSEAARLIGSLSAWEDLADTVYELVAAAEALDSARCLRILEQSLTAAGVVSMWDAVCRPALRRVDAREASDDMCIAGEHILSWTVAAALHRQGLASGTSADARVVLAAVDGERHTLPLEALAAALAERGIASRMLGAATPTATLVRTVTAVRPDAVVVWSQRPETEELPALRALARYRVRRIAAGPGWCRIPRGSSRATCLDEAVELVVDGLT